MRIIIDYNIEESNITAFAYNIGVMIEKIITERTNSLEEDNRLLEAKILDFSQKTTDINYKDHFGIKAVKEGKL